MLWWGALQQLSDSSHSSVAHYLLVCNNNFSWACQRSTAQQEKQHTQRDPCMFFLHCKRGTKSHVVAVPLSLTSEAEAWRWAAQRSCWPELQLWTHESGSSDAPAALCDDTVLVRRTHFNLKKGFKRIATSEGVVYESILWCGSNLRY